MHPGDRFLLGVNYWPRRKAMWWWADFDRGEVREEFAMISELGLTHVRIFLLWESFQPDPARVDPRALADLRIVCDIAAEAGLLLEPTFFTGHMSGPNWAPDWLLDPRRPIRPGDRQIVSLSRHAGADINVHDVYGEPFVLDAERLLLRAVCGELRDHPAVWAYSLGNEPDLLARPTTAAAGRAWMADMVGTIREVDPERPVLIGLHTASVHGDVGLRVDHASEATDVPVMHGYSIYDPLAREALDPDLVPFMAAVSAALAGRPVLFEEFGVNTHVPDRPGHWEDLDQWDGGRRRVYFASEQDAAAYYASVLPRLQRVGCLGAFAWCFADYDPALWDRPPCDLQKHERFFGLVRADGSFKPMALALRDFARSAPVVREPERRVELPVTPDRFYADPGRYLPALYEAFGRL
jgi:endo-1,4-beta-mannosidase